MKTPPKVIPPHLRSLYTLNDTISTEDWYCDDTGAYSGVNYNPAQFTEMIEKAKCNGIMNYPQTDALLHEALKKYPIKDQVVVIMGSGNPWYEAMVVAYGCKHCYVIEYQKRNLNHPMLTYLTVEEYNSNPIQFDCALSISSFEHDGLGRYGDPLNPNGDILAMEKMKSILKKDGLLYLAVPTGTDKLVCNAHRIYGNIRLPLLLKNWELISTHGDLKLDVDLGKHLPSQPVFILKNT